MIRQAVATVMECFPQVFLACHRRHVKDPVLKRVLSSHQASVLDHLDAVAPTHLRELAAHMGVTASTMSLMVDRLEAGGYVRRTRDAGDARFTNLRLTKAGVRIKEQQKVLEPKLVEVLLRRLAPSERETALTGLRHLARAADEMSAEGRKDSLRAVS